MAISDTVDYVFVDYKDTFSTVRFKDHITMSTTVAINTFIRQQVRSITK